MQKLTSLGTFPQGPWWQQQPPLPHHANPLSDIKKLPHSSHKLTNPLKYKLDQPSFFFSSLHHTFKKVKEPSQKASSLKLEICALSHTIFRGNKIQATFY